MLVAYGTENINELLPQTIEVYDAKAYINKQVSVSWSNIPDGVQNHVEGYECTLTGEGDGTSYTLTIYVLPVSSLNQKRKAGASTFNISGDSYSDGTYTGKFISVNGEMMFVLNDGSRLADCEANIGDGHYVFDENGFCCFNEYKNGYYYGEDRKRKEGETYSWSKDGEYDIYVDSKGNRLKLAYALIDKKLHFFDGKGHAWQTFEYPTYSLYSGNVLVGVPVEFDKTDKQKIIDRIVEIRKDAVQCGIMKESTFVVHKWSYALERGAMIRACEAALFSELAHKRPAAKAASLSFDLFKDCSERCLAWGNNTTLGAIDLYFLEKGNYLSKNGGVTGHYTALLYSDYIGTASISMESFEDNSAWASSNAYCTRDDAYYCDLDGVAIKYKDGTKYTVNDVIYKLHDLEIKDGKVVGGKAEAYKVKNKYYNLSIFNSLWFGEVEFPVTTIAASMAKNDKSAYYITIGENVESIGKNAFYGCKNTKKISINSKKLKASKVKKAFGKTPSNMKVYVPKNKLKTYKKLLKKRGMSKKVVFKKLKK